ncbi:histone-lysine n-methyltransferase [Niveomyces insectorum RCEF 264]|uniref:Histone-lysine n-methyltransferase n=1 Tax=Niveomyces insectorum RCEF 264 TaxID=1081102 RepID=A0A167W473_9HYPO|nr:histone-lysine n-methyltransferase [Niveomyces insectorum RCEF 264]
MPADTLPLKEESPADTGISDVPVFSGTRDSAQSTPASTLTNGSHGTKPEGDGIFLSPSAAAATVASVTVLSDAFPATLFSLPATPPPHFPEPAQPRSNHAAESAAMTLAADLAGDVASRTSDGGPPNGRHGEAELSPASATRSVSPTRVESHGEKSARGSAHAEHGSIEAVPLAEPVAFPDASFASSDSNANEVEPTNAAAPLLTPSASSPESHDAARNFEPSSEPLASRRPLRMVRQRRSAVQELQRMAQSKPSTPVKAAGRVAGKASPTAKQATPAIKATAKSGAASIERRVTRLSGLGLPTGSTATATPQTSLGKRKRRDSRKPSTPDIPRELRRLQDTKEFAHVDDNPVVYTVWSNGKYVPANAAGEPLPDKKAAAKTAKNASDSGAGETIGDGAAGQPPRKKLKGEFGAVGAGAPQVAGGDGEPGASKPPVLKRVKKWLNKGLYAGQPMPEKLFHGLTAAERKAMAKLPELTKEYPANKTLPQPIYNGLRLLLQGRDFKLPFDVFHPLPPGQPKPVKYGRFSKNRFVGEAHSIWRKNPHYDDFLSKCVCKPETGCDEDCQNRIMLYECNDMICNVGPELCHNREFQRLAERTASKNPYNIGVEVFKTPNRGHGIRASRSFRPGQIIMEYIGEIITEEESDRRMNELYKDNECYYLMSFDQSLIIDGTSGSIARFVNHSCLPNCRMIKWIVSGQPRIALFAGDRPIMTGEELTYDYNFDPYSSKNVQTCLCGSENCRGVLGPRKSEKAVSKAAADKLAAAKAKEALSSKKNETAAAKNAKRTKNVKLGKRSHDAYSMDDDEHGANKTAHATKKARIHVDQKRGPGRPRNDEPSKEPQTKASKSSAARKVTTTKAALEALAASAAMKARVTKAAMAAKAARAAKAAQAARAAKAEKARKAGKPTSVASNAKNGKAASGSKAPGSANVVKAGKTVKAGAAAAKATKATKAVKVVKAAKTVKVTRTAKGLRAAKTTKTAKAASAQTTPQPPLAKRASSARSAAKAATSPKAGRGRPTKATAEQLRAAAQLAPGQTAGGTKSHATPMAKALAKAAKEAAKTTPKPPARLAQGKKPTATATAVVVRPVGRPKGSVAKNKRTSNFTSKVAAKTAPKVVTHAAARIGAHFTAKTTTAASMAQEEKELAAQLWREALAKTVPEATPTAKTKINGHKTGQAGGSASSSHLVQQKLMFPVVDPPRRGRGRPRKVPLADAPSASTSGPPLGLDGATPQSADEQPKSGRSAISSAEDVIHVAST